MSLDPNNQWGSDWPAIETPYGRMLADERIREIFKENGGRCEPLGENLGRSSLPSENVIAFARALLAEAGPSREAQLQEWQPIQTAPTDGTRVLLGRFVAERDDFNGRISVDWYRQPGDASYIGWGQFNPHAWPATHWQRLPLPPNLQAARRLRSPQGEVK